MTRVINTGHALADIVFPVTAHGSKRKGNRRKAAKSNVFFIAGVYG